VVTTQCTEAPKRQSLHRLTAAPPRTCHNTKKRDLILKEVCDSRSDCFLNFMQPYWLFTLDQIVLPNSNPLAWESPFRGLDVYTRAPLFVPPTVGNEVLFH